MVFDSTIESLSKHFIYALDLLVCLPSAQYEVKWMNSCMKYIRSFYFGVTKIVYLHFGTLIRLNMSIFGHVNFQNSLDLHNTMIFINNISIQLNEIDWSCQPWIDFKMIWQTSFRFKLIIWMFRHKRKACM